LKALNFQLALISANRISVTLTPLNFNKKSNHNAMKMASDTTWNAKPAIIIFRPALLELGVFAVAAIPPPIACRRSEMKSLHMNMIA
jgi:hypothetical protein